MQRLINSELILDIEMIEGIAAEGRDFEIAFANSNRDAYKLIFGSVWDMRCSIENASIMRFIEFRKCLPEGLIHNGIYIVENSEYTKYLEYELGETMPIDEITHYIVQDRVDTIIDILAWRHKPTVEPILDGKFKYHRLNPLWNQTVDNSIPPPEGHGEGSTIVLQS